MAEVTCPQCGTLANLEEGQHAFCTNCDYPLFWAGKQDARNEQAEVLSASGGEIDEDEQVTDVICRTCAERNPGNRAFCLKCGSELTRADEEFDPEAPPALILGEAEPPRSSRFVRMAIGVLAVFALLGGGYLGYREWDARRIPPVSVATLDATGDTGYDTAIQVGEGAPFVVYRDQGAKALRAVRCKQPNCLGELQKVALVSQGDPGHDLLVDLAGGAPLVLYRDQATKSLRVVRCGTFACDNAEGSRRFATVDDGGDPGHDSAIAVGGGIPIVTYRSAATGTLKAALLCANECSDDDGPVLERGSANGRVLVTLVGGQNVDTGYNSAVAIPTGGTPYVAYRDGVNKSLRLLHCTNRSCSKHDEPIILVAADVGYDTAMVIGQSAFPIIATRNNENNTLMIITCGDVDCTKDKRTQEVVDNGGADGHKVGFGISMVLGPSGNPIVVYRDETEKAMKILRCGDATCTVGARSIAKLDPAVGTDDGFDTAARLSGGLLYVSYRDATTKALKFARVRP
ncbi:MAG: hypothetical protein WC211_09145 [Dehalococcoidia bacterium]